MYWVLEIWGPEIYPIAKFLFGALTNIFIAVHNPAYVNLLIFGVICSCWKDRWQRKFVRVPSILHDRLRRGDVGGQRPWRGSRCERVCAALPDKVQQQWPALRLPLWIGGSRIRTQGSGSWTLWQQSWAESNLLDKQSGQQFIPEKRVNITHQPSTTAISITILYTHWVMTLEASGPGEGWVVNESTMPSLRQRGARGLRCMDLRILKAVAYEWQRWAQSHNPNKQQFVNNTDSNWSPKRESILPQNSTPLHYQ